MHPGSTQDRPRTHPGWTQESVLRVLYAPSAACSAGSLERPTGNPATDRTRMEHRIESVFHLCLIRGSLIFHLLSLILRPCSPLALWERIGERAFSAIIPKCKQMSTLLWYSCGGFRRNPLRHNGLRAGKLFAPRPDDLAPPRGTIAVNRCRIRTWEFSTAAGNWARIPRRGKHFLENSLLVGMAKTANPLGGCRATNPFPGSRPQRDAAATTTTCRLP